MSLKAKWNDFWIAQSNLFKDNKLKYLLEISIKIGLLIFFFSLPSFSFNQYHNLPIVIMGGLGLLMVIWNIFYGRFFVDAIIASIIGYLITVLISSAIYHFRDINTTLFLLPVMFVIFYHYFVCNKKSLKTAISLFALGVFFFSVYFVIVYFKDIISLDFDRLGREFGDQNEIGGFFALAYTIYLFYLLFQKKWWTLPCILIFLFLGFSTGSKSFLFSVGLVTIVYIIQFFGKKKWYLSILIILGLGGLFFLVMQLPFLSSFKTRIMDLFNYISSGDVRDDGSTFGRVEVAIEGLELFLRRPFFGWGINGVVSNSFLRKMAHNTIVELLVDFGLISCILFELPVFICLKTFIRSKENGDKYKHLYLVFIIFILFRIFVEVHFKTRMYFVLLAFLCAGYYQMKSPREYFKLSFSLKDEETKSKQVRFKNTDYMFLVPSLDTGGAERMTARIALALAEQGYKVTILLCFRNDTEYDAIHENCQVISVADDKESYLQLGKLHRIKTIRRYIKKLDPQHIVPFLYHICDYTFLATLCTKYRKRVYVTIINTPKKKPLSRLHFYLRFVKGCIVQSEGQKNLFKKSLHDKIKIIPNFIEEENFEFPKAYNSQIQSIIAIGRFVVEKDYGTLIDAFAHSKYVNQLTLTICGDGELKEQVEQKINDYGLQDRIVLTGFVSDILNRLLKSDLFILSSKSEGMPNVLLEAMSLGVPCISTDCAPVIKEMIVSSKYGLIVPVGESDRLSNAIDYMVENPIEASEKGKNAREFSKNKYAKHIIVSLWANI